MRQTGYIGPTKPLPTHTLLLSYGWFRLSFRSSQTGARRSTQSAFLCSIKILKSACAPSQGIVKPQLTSGSYFGHFHGFSKCNIRATDLYLPPLQQSLTDDGPNPYCHDRKSLLKAMSNGGRVGFEAPYSSRGTDLQHHP